MWRESGVKIRGKVAIYRGMMVIFKKREEYLCKILINNSFLYKWKVDKAPPRQVFKVSVFDLK